MNKALKTILITAIVIFGASVFSVSSILAQGNLVVEFEQTPLFNEVNFLPGQSITRWVKVTNNNGETQRIATEAINVGDSDRLGDVLNLEIKEGQITLYNNPLSTFFNVGEVFLSNLTGNGGNTQYDFTVSFYPGAQNPFQGKTLSFDILIGFQGEEGGLLPGAGGGAGGFLPPGLTVLDESVRVTTTTETSVTITWTTSYLSTSQVIYAREGESHTLDLTDNIGTPPKYGYAHTTPEYDVSPKVTAHSVTITGLTPGTKYYYRAVSHASLAISREFTFTTLAVETEKEGPVVPPEEEAKRPEVAGGVTEEAPAEEEFQPEVILPGEKEEPVTKKVISRIIAFPGDLASILVANLGMAWEEIGQSTLKTVGVVFLLAVLVGILGKEVRIQIRKKRRK